MKFGNFLRKINLKTEWYIYSGSTKIGKLRKENKLHYLYLDKSIICSIEELEEIINICKDKAGVKIK